MTTILSSKADMSSILYEGRAESSEKEDVLGMIDELWRERLTQALDASGKSKRSVSLAAGLGPGYLHSILAEGKEPTVQNIIAICGALEIAASSILFGFEMSAATEEIVQKLGKMEPGKQRALLKLLEDTAP